MARYDWEVSERSVAGELQLWRLRTVSWVSLTLRTVSGSTLGTRNASVVTQDDRIRVDKCTLLSQISNESSVYTQRRLFALDFQNFARGQSCLKSN